MRRFRRHFVLASGLMAVAVIVLGLMVLFFPQRVLTVESGEVKGDVIVLLGGAWLERPQRVLELFQAGEAPKILISGIGECDYDKRMLETNGVPESAIFLEPKSRTTRENVKFSIPLLRSLGAHQVIIVTSWYHSRRALACFEHYAQDIQFYSRPSYCDYPSSDSHRKWIGSYIRAEYVKLLGYWVCYGVCPF